MTANELRIGNWIYDGQVGFKEEFRVGSGDIVSIDSNDIDCDYRPIRLTEEWLVRFGFNVRSISKTYSCYNKGERVQINIQRSEDLNIYEDTFWFKVYNGTISIRYVHQLQNLYFALTGNELTIKHEIKEG
jgi:hypothetical protein